MEAFVGIPGTLSPEVRQLRWIRQADHPSGRIYEAQTPDGLLRAIVSQDAAGKDGNLLWHLSVSHRDRDGKPLRVPTWDELKHARYQLLRVDCCMVMVFPRPGAPYVDLHPTTLHLWESEKEIDL